MYLLSNNYQKLRGCTYKVRSLMPQIEVDHCGDGLNGDQELGLHFAHLTELVKEHEILRQVLQVRFCGVVLQLKHNSYKMIQKKQESEITIKCTKISRLYRS